MTLRTLLRFQNPDSTQDINERTKDLVNKGVFSGGDVTAIASTLTVTLAPFATVGFDGMFVREDESTILSVDAGIKNFIVVRQRYVASADPIVSVESLTETAFNGDADPNALIVFAVVDVPVTATEVLQSYIEFFERDEIDPVGRLFFRGQLANTGLLPLGSANINRAGDFYIITNGSGGFPEIFSWNGLDWVNITQSQTMISLLDIHRDNLDVDRIHATSQQADALLGTVGTPSISNRYVTALDPRIPNQNENDALQADPTNLSEFVPSGSNRYINSSKIFAVPASTDFPASPFLIELTDARGPYFVGKGGIGTGQQFFNIYSRDSATLGDDDQELLNSEFQPVRITGIFTEASFTIELNPIISSDALGFFSGGSLFVQISNPADKDFTISYGKRTLLGDMVPESFLLRGPQSGQVDARVRQILESSVNGQFNDSAWDAGTSPGDVVAFDIGTGRFVKHDLGLSRFPVGLRGNTNNLIAEGLYEFTSATSFSPGDQVYAHNTTAGALSTTVNARFMGTFFDSTRLLINMNAFGISASSFIPGVDFPGSLFEVSLLSGEVAAFNTGTGKFERWDDAEPTTPAPDGLRGNSNNIIQVGSYQAVGSPYIAGTRFYASTTSDGQLTTGQNDFFIGHATASNELLVNVTGGPNWETARSIFAVEHADTSGIHSEGSARTFVGLAADAGISTSNSLASSTGMTLFATDTGQVFYCTNGATNIWVEASRFTGPLEITNALEVGGNLVLPTGILDDDAGDTFNVFSHAARHLATGADPISGVISQVLLDGETSGVVLTGAFQDLITIAIDFTGRSGDSTILLFAVMQGESTSAPTEVEYRFTLDSVAIVSPFSQTHISSIPAVGQEASMAIQGVVNSVANTGIQNLALQARNFTGATTIRARHLILLDLGPN